MKKILLILPILMSVTGSYAATQAPVAISSGTGFYQVDVSTSISGGRVRQNIVIGDPNVAGGLAPVDIVTGLTVNLATSSASGIGSISNTSFGATQASAWNLTNSTVGVTGTVGATQSGPWNLTNSTVGVTGTIAATQSGPWNLTNSTVGVTGTIAATQSGPWNLTNSTVGISGTVPVTGTFFQSVQPVSTVGTVAITPSTGTYPISGNIGQSGTYTTTPGTGTWPVSGIGTFAVVPASGTFAQNLTQVGGSAVTTAAAGEPRVSCEISGSSNTVTASVSVAPVANQFVSFSTSTTLFLSSATFNTALAISTPIAASGSTAISVYRMIVNVSSSTNINFRDGSANLTDTYFLTPSGSLTFDLANEPWYQTSTTNSFGINQSGTAVISGKIWYIQK